MMRPVSGPGFRGRFWANFGSEPNVDGPKSDSNLLEPYARASWDWIVVRSHQLCGQIRPKTGPDARHGDWKSIKQPELNTYYSTYNCVDRITAKKTQALK